ncbi:MAG: hypothetical protein K8T26_15160 [Lentisphaerae bacterium]|nr:hypothetical protein [Lentisphaerota bacterium]
MDTGTLSEIGKLLVLQEHDVRIRQIERELRDIPERKKGEEQRLATHQADAAKADDHQKGRQAAIKDLELEVASKREQILKLRRQQVDLKTNKEFQAIDSEIKSVESAIAGLEDKELELMALLEEANQLLAASKRELADEASVVKRDVVAWDQRAAALEAEVATLRAQRDAAAALVQQKAWLALYQRVFSRKDNALVPIEGGVCGGCHLQLPPYVVHEMKKQGTLVTCNFCGRLLYER